MFIYEQLHEYESGDTVDSHETRNNHNLTAPKCRLAKVCNSHFVVGVKLFNKIDFNIRNIDNSRVFKTKVKYMLFSKNFYTV